MIDNVLSVKNLSISFREKTKNKKEEKSGDKDNVVDADFEDVKDDKEKSA